MEKLHKNYKWMGHLMMYKSACCKKDVVKEKSPGGYEYYNCKGCGDICDVKLVSRKNLKIKENKVF